MFLRSLVCAALLSFTVVFADTDFELDPPPRILHKIIESPSFPIPGFLLLRDARSKSNLDWMIQNQTPVKSQGMRGTCSIFSAAGEVESLLKLKLGKEFDLSENYLQFIVMTRVKSYPSEGSDTSWNIPAFQKYGAIYETDWPYEPYSWLDHSSLTPDEARRVASTCGAFQGTRKAACLLTHLDPEDQRYDSKAISVQAELGLEKLETTPLYEQDQIKKHLDEGRPLLLGIEFFYGAWNHRKMEEYGIGRRNMVAWEKGIVSTPTQRDVHISKAHPAGHSIVVVGYDDAKRVYYFKNSWGTESFGITSDLLGKEGMTKGYGSISYEYAHNYGSFQAVGFLGN